MSQSSGQNHAAAPPIQVEPVATTPSARPVTRRPLHQPIRLPPSPLTENTPPHRPIGNSPPPTTTTGNTPSPPTGSTLQQRIGIPPSLSNPPPPPPPPSTGILGSNGSITSGPPSGPPSRVAVRPQQGPPSRVAVQPPQSAPPPPPVAVPSNSNPPTPQKEWRSKKLQAPFMICAILFETALIVSIIYLERRSASKDGITSVPQVNNPASGHFTTSTVWNFGLLWSTLPTFIVTVYKLAWEGIVSDTADRQPFVELARQQNHATAKTTVMLDYRSYSVFFNWFHAWRRGHILLGCSMLLSLLLSIAVVPLSAFLFFQAPSQLISIIDIGLTTVFNDSAVTSFVSLQPAIDLATSTRVYGGNPPPWMTLEYAFEAFEAGPSTSSTTGNITYQNATAYSAYLDCQTYPESVASNDDNTLNYRMNDRGCQVVGFINLINTTRTYSTSWTTTCSNITNGDRRLGMIAGIYSDSSPLKLANFSLISCIPSYWQKQGALTVAMSPNPTTPPQFISFTPTASHSIQPFSYQTIEDSLIYYTFFDPSNTIVADALGFSILSYATTLNASSPIQPDLIKNATEDTFTTLYAGLAANTMLQPVTAASTATGASVLSAPITKLYVVTPVAYTIVAVLFLVLICNILLFVYAKTAHSMLVEEPIGLLGSAALLLDSNVLGIVATARENRPEGMSVGGFLRDKYTVEDSKCYVDGSGRFGKIAVDDLTVRP